MTIQYKFPRGRAQLKKKWEEAREKNREKEKRMDVQSFRKATLTQRLKTKITIAQQNMSEIESTLERISNKHRVLLNKRRELGEHSQVNHILTQHLEEMKKQMQTLKQRINKRMNDSRVKEATKTMKKAGEIHQDTM